MKKIGIVIGILVGVATSAFGGFYFGMAYHMEGMASEHTSTSKILIKSLEFRKESNDVKSDELLVLLLEGKAAALESIGTTHHLNEEQQSQLENVRQAIEIYK
jgi:hypothetical protein